MTDDQLVALLHCHVERVRHDPSQHRRSMLGIIRALEGRYDDLDIGCPEELVRRTEADVEEREPVTV